MGKDGAATKEPTEPIESAHTAPTGEASKRELPAHRLSLRPFAIVSICYLLFTTTDGALRMIVLWHAYNKRFSAMQVALMFTLYELAGVFTNLAAGLAGARWGIQRTLVAGLLLQLATYALLFGWRDEWGATSSIIYVTVVQMFGGIAKDLTKLGGKTVTKLVTPEGRNTRLFKLVSLLTGWKNSLKGVGYFLGSALVAVRYELALGVMLGIVALALPFAVLGLDASLGTARKQNATWEQVFRPRNPNLSWLSLARLFLFASRDFWFEVPLPFFLRSPACAGLGTDACTADADCTSGAFCHLRDANATVGVCQNSNVGGGCGGLGWDRLLVGTLLACYIIGYGQIQSYTPQLVTGPLRQSPPNKLVEVMWGLINCLPTAAMAIVAGIYGWSVDAAARSADEQRALQIAIIAVVVVFAAVFAVNSSIHSFLVVKYAAKDKVATSVGFYYMSNACGRLLGTLCSGALYTYVGRNVGPLAGSDAVAGLAACFIAGTLSSLIAALITLRIRDDDVGLRCGPLVCVRGLNVEEPEEAEGGADS